MKATNRKLFRNGLITLAVLALLCCSYASAPTVQAQTPLEFTPATEFSIPEQNGLIRFAYNGTYTQAVLQNGSWVFINLSINSSSPVGNLTVSATDSQVTINTFFSSLPFNQFGRMGLVSFYVTGVGEQAFNLGLNLNRSTHQSEWSIIVPANPDGTGSVFLAEGKDWNLLSDNTIVLNGLEGAVTIAYFRSGFNSLQNSSQPFYLQHSVAIVTIGVLAATVSVASLISFWSRRKN